MIEHSMNNSWVFVLPLGFRMDLPSKIGSGSRFLIWLQGGGDCSTKDSCDERCYGVLPGRQILAMGSRWLGMYPPPVMFN